MHTAEKKSPYKCSICHKLLPYNFALKNHMKRFHQQREVTQPGEPLASTSEQNVPRHVQQGVGRGRDNNQTAGLENMMSGLRKYFQENPTQFPTVRPESEIVEADEAIRAKEELVRAKEAVVREREALIKAREHLVKTKEELLALKAERSYRRDGRGHSEDGSCVQPTTHTDTAREEPSGTGSILPRASAGDTRARSRETPTTNTPTRERQKTEDLRGSETTPHRMEMIQQRPQTERNQRTDSQRINRPPSSIEGRNQAGTSRNPPTVAMDERAISRHAEGISTQEEPLRESQGSDDCIYVSHDPPERQADRSHEAPNVRSGQVTAVVRPRPVHPVNVTPSSSGQRVNPVNATPSSNGQRVNPVNVTPSSSDQRVNPVNVTPTSNGQRVNPLNVIPSSSGQRVNPVNVTPSSNSQRVNPVNVIPSSSGQRVNPVNVTPSSSGQQSTQHPQPTSCSHGYSHISANFDFFTDGNGVAKFKCKICNKIMNRNYQTQHQCVHMNIRRYPCHYCGKSFVHNSTLIQHRRMHTGEKPFECRYCDKRFSRKGTLVNHERIHTGERPFVCPICQQRFIRRASLKHHMRNRHAEMEQISKMRDGETLQTEAIWGQIEYIYI